MIRRIGAKAAGAAWACGIAAALVTGCSSSTEESAEPVTVETVLDTAADAMATVDTVAFLIESSGAPVYLDEGGALAFQQAEGRFSSEAAGADAVVAVTALGIDTQVGAVSLDGELWLSNPLTGAWDTAPESITFDPVTLFDPDTGWQPLLRSDLTGAELVGDGSGGDGDQAGRWHVTGEAAGSRLSAVTGGLVDEDAPIDLWIDRDTGHVVEATFETTSEAGVTSWRMELSDYGAEVTITRPDSGTDSGTDSGS